MSDPKQVQDFIERVVRERFQADMHGYEEFRATRDPIFPVHAQQGTEECRQRLDRQKRELASRSNLADLRHIVGRFVRTHYGEEGAATANDP